MLVNVNGKRINSNGNWIESNEIAMNVIAIRLNMRGNQI